MFGINDYGKAIVDFENFEFSQFGDALFFGGAILLMGMVTIFAVLCILWLCLVIFKIVFHDLPKKRKAGATKVEEVSAPVEVTPVSSGDEIIAAISAAIAMAESESSGIKFRVVSFKRK